MLIGHQKIVACFDSILESGQAGQAYCFVGAAQIGKRTLARELAGKLLKLAPDQLYRHPDFYYLQRIEKEKTGKLNRDVSVDQARDWRERWVQRPWLGGYKVAIIDEAETLSAGAGNALLKLLEESPAHGVIFLLTENDALLLPTIRSRSQSFYFSLVGETELLAGLRKLDHQSADLEPIARLARGRPGRAIDFLINPDLYQQELAEIDRFKQLSGAPFYRQIQLIENLFGDKEDAVRGRQKLSAVLDLWTILWRDQLIGGGDSLRIKEIIDWLSRAKELLRQNIHPRLLLEQAVMKF